MQKMGRVKTGGRMGMEKLRVRLFLNLSKFRTISFWDYYHLLKGSSSPCGERNAEKKFASFGTFADAKYSSANVPNKANVGCEKEFV